MPKFHILFKLSKEQFSSSGEIFESKTAVTALIEFYGKYPKAIFLGAYSLDEVSALMLSHHQIEVTPFEDHKESERLKGKTN